MAADAAYDGEDCPYEIDEETLPINVIMRLEPLKTLRASQIPALKQLYTQLGISPDKKGLLQNSIISWRAKSQTGPLKPWGNEKIRLHTMAEEFFGYYEKTYWPEGGETERIICVIMQIFYRSNLYKHHNCRKKQRKGGTAIPQSPSVQRSMGSSSTLPSGPESFSPELPGAGNLASSTTSKIPDQRQKIISSTADSNRLPIWVITKRPKRTEELWFHSILQYKTLWDCTRQMPGLIQRSESPLEVQFIIKTVKSDLIISVWTNDADKWEYAKEYLTRSFKMLGDPNLKITMEVQSTDGDYNDDPTPKTIAKTFCIVDEDSDDDFVF